jgi:serine/threonine protein phosphatase PrpC
MSWKVAHACIRGSSHQRSGLPNQDAAQCTVTPGAQGTVAVAVVSDGHGSPRHFRSQIGSSLAVSTVAGTLQGFLRESVSSNGHVPFVPEQVHELERKIVSGWLAAVHADLEHNPFTEAELANLEKEDGAEGRAAVESSPELAYGATLLAAGATDKVLLYLQLGDGEILSVNATGTTTRPLPPDDRLIANQTTSLCQPEAWKDFRSSWVTDAALPSLVLLSTDGYANSFRSDEDFLKIGQDYLEIIRQQGIASLAEELPAILTEATQQGSGDDITLAILQDDLGSATGGTKVPRPLMTGASKSALIEQLKARHSSQQQKLHELAVRVEQTRQDNRRLRNTLLLLLAAAIAVPVAIFHNRIFPHTPGPTPVAPTIGTPPPSKKPGPASPTRGSARKAVGQAWTLQLNGGQPLSLYKGAAINPHFIHAKANSEDYPNGDYARVASKEEKGPLFLFNDSKDTWVVSTGQKIGYGHDWKLGAEPVNITFAPKITGTLAPVAEAAPETADQ